MKVKKVDRLTIFTPDHFKDERGSYIETFNLEKYRDFIVNDFVQDDFSKSKKGTFRGLHGDSSTWKLISCPFGEFSLLIIDCDPSSSFFSKIYTFEFSSENYFQVLIPPLCANGHFIRSKEAVFNYKQSTYYNKDDQFSINIKSPLIEHQFDVELLSKRDQSSPILENSEKLKQYIQNYLKH